MWLKKLWARIIFEWKWWRAPYVASWDTGTPNGDKSFALVFKKVDGIIYVVDELTDPVAIKELVRRIALGADGSKFNEEVKKAREQARRKER